MECKEDISLFVLDGIAFFKKNSRFEKKEIYSSGGVNVRVNRNKG
jgi:hypothetical protein